MTRIHADLRKPVYVSWLEFLRDADKWDAERIEAHQFEELRRIVEYAYNHTAGYRHLFSAAGVHPLDLQEVTHESHASVTAAADWPDSVFANFANEDGRVARRSWVRNPGGPAAAPVSTLRHRAS